LLTIISPEVLGTALDGSFVESWESVVYFGAIASLLALSSGLLLTVALGM